MFCRSSYLGRNCIVVKITSDNLLDNFNLGSPSLEGAMASISPESSGELLARAKSLQENGQLQGAMDFYGLILTQEPGHTVALQELANISRIQGNLTAAANYYTRLIALQPQNVQWLLPLSQVCFEDNKYREAYKYLERAIKVQPQSAVAYSNIGYILYLLGDHAEAEKKCRLAIQLHPDFVDAHCNLGIALLAQGRSTQAHEVFLRALQLNPDLTLAWSNLAIILMDSGKLSESILASRRALQLEPHMADAYCNLGMALQESLQQDEALRVYEQALSLEPHHPAAQSNRLMCMQYMLDLNSAELRQAASGFGLGYESTGIIPVQAKPVHNRKQLRIGYVSADFNRHPVGWFFNAVLAAHDKEKAEIHCYQSSSKEDSLTARMRQNADRWHSIQRLTDREAAEKIRKDGIDILVDLAGHTAGNRLGIFELKPAPLQVSWLGYFASTGVKNMDYVFIGADQVPPGSEAYFQEEIYRLRQCQFCYTPPDYSPQVVEPPHIDNGFITFGCFNNSAKLNHEVLSLWAQLMQQIPNSRLVLKWKSFNDPHLCGQIYNIFELVGIGAERILLRSASEHQIMLAEYGDIDLALDPFPFSGALTTCEALWMGVPVITFPHLRPVSRQSAAILNNIGLTDLIADCPGDYVAKTCELASSSERLVQLRTDLRQKMKDSLKNDGRLLARELEIAFFSVYGEDM